MASLAAARKALASGSWSQADSAFRAVIAQSGDSLAHEGLAQVAWWTDDADTCLTARETAYRLSRERGDAVGAARAATALAWDSLLFGCGRAVAMGWLGLAWEMLEGLEEGPEHGWCLVREGEMALAADLDPALANGYAVRAAEVGQRIGDRDLTVVGLALQGIAQIRMGQVRDGMAFLDPAAAAATAGEVTDLMWTGKVLCWLIAACHETRDAARAREWCHRVERMCRALDLVPLLQVCRIQYASVQVSAGVWLAAEQDLMETVVRLDGSQRASRLEAVVQLGELRRRQGRFEEAEVLFEQAEFDPLSILGRALIKHAEGHSASAWSSLQRLLGMLPLGNRLLRAEVLLPATRVARSLGLDQQASSAADELRLTALEVGTEALLGMSAAADAALAQPPEDTNLLHEAVRYYHRAGLRLDEVEARLLLGEGLADQADVIGAQEQLTTATRLMADCRDTAGLAKAQLLQHRIASRSSRVLTDREVEVLGLVARGLTNEQIAQTLTVSPHTIHRHVANILTKLDQPTRAAAVGEAMTTGLL